MFNSASALGRFFVVLTLAASSAACSMASRPPSTWHAHCGAGDKEACRLVDAERDKRIASLQCSNLLPAHRANVDEIGSSQASEQGFAKKLITCRDFRSLVEAKGVPTATAAREAASAFRASPALLTEFRGALRTGAAGTDMNRVGEFLTAYAAANGPQVADAVAELSTRAAPRMYPVVFSYLAHEKHGEARAKVGDFLGREHPADRALGCAVAGDLGATEHRAKVGALAQSDLTSVAQGGARVYPVRDACQSALSKLKE